MRPSQCRVSRMRPAHQSPPGPRAYKPRVVGRLWADVAQRVLLGKGCATMLSSAGHQYAIAIFMIIFFGLQFVAAGIFLLYKRVGIPISLGGDGIFGVGVTIVKDNSADTIAALAE